MKRPAHLRRIGTACVVTLTVVSGIWMTACSSVVAPEATCVAVVNVDGAFYGASSLRGPEPAEVSSVPHVIVTRNTGCLDQGEQASELLHGESNFLPIGTPLHTVAGFPAAERLAVRSAVLGEWRFLTTTPEND